MIVFSTDLSFQRLSYVEVNRRQGPGGGLGAYGAGNCGLGRERYLVPIGHGVSLGAAGEAGGKSVSGKSDAEPSLDLVFIKYFLSSVFLYVVCNRCSFQCFHLLQRKILKLLTGFLVTWCL